MQASWSGRTVPQPHAHCAPAHRGLRHRTAADLVINNARIWSDGLVTFAESATVRDGRFIHVGAPIDELIGPGTTVIDAAGRVVIPGLIDSHVHMLGGGSGLMQL